LWFILCTVFSGYVLGCKQEKNSVVWRVRVLGPLVIFNFWGHNDAQQTDILSREWKEKSRVEKVNSSCTKQEELGTVKAQQKVYPFARGGVGSNSQMHHKYCPSMLVMNNAQVQ